MPELAVAPEPDRVRLGRNRRHVHSVFSEDFNAYIASGADPALVAGATVNVQHWSRDPAASFGDRLSNAVTAVIAP
jgi:hypothetical protein